MAAAQAAYTLGVIISGLGSGAQAGAFRTMPEDAFCRQLCKLGKASGLLVCLIDHASVQSPSELTGYTLNDTVWQRVSIPPPDVVYDRALCRSARQYREHAETLAELRRRKPYILMNGSLPGKLEVFSILEGDERLRPFLPPTSPFGGTGQLAGLAGRSRRGLFLKPSAGMQGKGALRLLQASGCWRIDGNDRLGRPVAVKADTLEAAAEWIGRFIGGSRYAVQPYLRLTGEDSRPFDIRALVQKDGSGRWSFTGAALRQGPAGRVTANLHGGGQASEAVEGLAGRFGERAAAALLGRIRRLSLRAAERLEQSCGRLAEIGFDYGIEEDGRLWLLEANSRPGRQSFAGSRDAKLASVLQPLRYARLLAGSRGPILTTDDKTKPFKLRDTDPVIADDRIHRRYVQEVHP